MSEAPASMPSEEEIARALMKQFYEQWYAPHRPAYQGSVYWDYVNGSSAWGPPARAILALFAPILAEKEREIASREPTAFAIDLGRKLAIQADRADAAEARALAAEAALAPFADEKNGAMQDILWGDQPDSATMTITCPLGHVRKAREVVRAAAIRAQGE